MLNFTDYTGIYMGTWSISTDQDPADLSPSFERSSGKATFEFSFNPGELFTGPNPEYEALTDPSYQSQMNNTYNDSIESGNPNQLSQQSNSSVKHVESLKTFRDTGTSQVVTVGSIYGGDFRNKEVEFFFNLMPT